MRADMNPARWLTDALEDVHAVRMRHRGCLCYAMLTSRAARRHVRLRLPSHHFGEPTHVVGTINRLAERGVTGLPYPKRVDAEG